jgi:hypothetical protein
LDARRRQTLLLVLAGAGVLLLSSLPYLRGWSLAGSDASHAWYSGLPRQNVADNAVYWAWLRAAADGAVVEENRFTTQPQSGLKVNVYYAAAGRVARALGLGPRAFFHVSRLFWGALLLAALWRLASLLLEGERARWLGWLCVCLSSGLGWAWELLAPGARPRPTDLWQIEGFTFLSLYWSPHFLFPLLLMIGIVCALVEAERRRSYGWAAAAGLLGLVLADVHTYDLVPLGFAWALYLGARAAREGRFDPWAWRPALLAAALTLPGAAYMAWVLRQDAVFAARAAVLTVSPPLYAIVVGYGATLALAVVGLGRARGAALLLGYWALGSVLAAYLPVPFQRKLLMGVHVPLGLLAGAGLDALTRGRLAPAAALAALFASNALFLVREARGLARNAGPIRAYLREEERQALAWLERHAAPGDAAQPLPWVSETAPGRIEIVDTTLAHFVPGLAGLRVDCGHFGETPSYRERLYGWARLGLPGAPDRLRLAWLRQSGVRWLVVSQPEGEGAPFAPARERPRWLRPVPEAPGVYEVLPATAEPSRRPRAARPA